MGLYMLPCIDKPTRVYRDFATLIDNIFLNNITVSVSGNIITDLSDHFSQFCIVNSMVVNETFCKRQIRDYSRFSQKNFNYELSLIDWESLFLNEKIIQINYFLFFIKN